MTAVSRSRKLALPLLVALPLTACSIRPAPHLAGAGPFEGQVITRQQIEATHARTAWDILRNGNTPLRLVENGNGTPRSISRRGQNSVYLNTDPRVVLDGVPVAGLHILHELSANDVESIRILDARSGATFYGTAGGNGVIEIRTRRGLDR